MRHAFPIVLALLVGAVLMVLVEPLLGGLDSPATANRVLIAGTVATAVATVALAAFAALQIRDARHQQRGVAAALLEEVSRIRVELGSRPGRGEEPLIINSRTGGVPADRSAIVTDAAVPEVHPWFHRVIPQIAESDAAIVGLFLTLDRHLTNYGHRVGRLVNAQHAAKESREALERWMAANPHAVGMDAVLVRQNSEHEVAMTIANLSVATTETVTLYRACHATLDGLTKRLDAVLA